MLQHYKYILLENKTVFNFECAAVHNGHKIAKSLNTDCDTYTQFHFQGPASNATPVKTSFVKVHDDVGEHDCVCLTIGRELFYFMNKAIQQVHYMCEILFLIIFLYLSST